MTRTDHRTLRSAPTADGWRELVHADGAAHDGSPPAPNGEVVAVLAHLSDLHICDAESPARIEYLERHGMEGGPYRSMLGEIGCYRPQEILTVPVAAAMIEAVNGVARGPLTGRPVDAAVLTGDLVDNAQSNELDWYLTLLTGGTIIPTSGRADRSEWVGAADAAWSASFWHPDGHRSDQTDQWTERLAFPRIPGLLEAAGAPVSSPGLEVPWFGVHGNHDLLLQGTVAPDSQTRALALGGRRITDLAPDETVLVVLEAVAGCGPARYPEQAGAPAIEITSDARRRLLDPAEFSARHDALGHHQVERGPGNAFSVAVSRSVRLVALDTVNPHGGWQGSLDRTQFEWLKVQLDRTDQPYVVIGSHHPSWCLVNGYRPGHLDDRGSADDRVLANELLRLLLDRPRVIAWLAGHVHYHRVVTHRRGERVLPEITSASFIDWPQQCRMLEIVREPAGTLALVSTALDHVGPDQADRRRLDEPGHLASLSRTLAANAPYIRGLAPTGRGPGGAIERNTVVRVPDPA